MKRLIGKRNLISQIIATGILKLDHDGTVPSRHNPALPSHFRLDRHRGFRRRMGQVGKSQKRAQLKDGQ